MLSSAQVIHFFETQIDHAHTVVSALLLGTQLQRIKNISFRNLSNLSHQREMSNQLLVSSELGLHIAHSSEKEPLKLWVPLQIKLQHLEHQLLQQREPRMLITDRQRITCLLQDDCPVNMLHRFEGLLEQARQCDIE